ncbi:apolipoprotein C-IV isoform 1-T1 [Menidia menidia]
MSLGARIRTLVFSLLLLIQACPPALAQTEAPEQPDSPGILQRLTERARQAKAKIQSIGDTALGFAGAYYEDHIQPVASSYVEWASNVRMSLRERMQKTIDNYRPFDK